MTIVDEQPARDAECWCCGRREAPARMVRLGNHPEVTLCLRCARTVGKNGREIEDRDRSGLGVRARDGFRTVRKAVVRRGWHNVPVVGPGLRWLGRHTP